MIKLIQRGKYILFEGGDQLIIVLDDKQTYTWNDGLFSIISDKSSIDKTSSGKKGSYRIYDVKDESLFANAVHLELFIGEGKWVGYLLPEGLPAENNNGRIIMPVEKTITKTTH